MNITHISRDHQSRCPKILDIRVDDPMVIEELATRDSLQAQREYGEELLELGARVARTQRPVSEADRVIQAYEGFERRTERRFNALSDKIQEQAESARATVTTVEETVAQVTERSGQAVQTLLEEMGAQVERAEGDSDRLAKLFKERLQIALNDLSVQVVRAEQVIASGLNREQALLEQRDLREQTSNRKGIEFEELVNQDLLRFGRARGDLVEATGTKSSAGTTSKKGDLFYQLQVGDRHLPVVIECKDEPLTMSGANPFRLTDLEKAMKERGGDYGIVVANIEQNSDSDGPKFPVLQCFGDNRFVVLVDREQECPVALETALSLIHRAATHKQHKQETPEVDIAAISQVVENIVRTSDRFRGLKGTCTNLGTQLARLREQLDDLDNTLEDQTDQLKSLIGMAA